MNTTSSPDAQPGSRWARRFSAQRLVLTLLVAVGLVLTAAYVFWAGHDQGWATPATPPIEKRVLSMFASADVSPGELAERFVDADADLVADPPTNAADELAPDPLVFSYVASEAAEPAAEAWQEVLAKLQSATGRQVEFVSFTSVEAQEQALDEGQLHVTAFNSGAVPRAVARHGFVPVCCPGDAAGKFGYRMQIIVAGDSPIRELADLRGGQLVFTHLSSNSGFKAPLVLLREKYGLEPQRDYDWAFSGSHRASIAGVADGKYQAAAVAGDLLEPWLAQDPTRQDRLRVIYESERFPPAVLGHVWRLRGDLAAQVREALLQISLADSPLVGELGAPGVSQMVPVVYKDDWALIRQVDEKLALLRAPRQETVSSAPGPAAGNR